YNRQHQDVRVENGVHYGDVLSGVDSAYLAQVTRLNIVSMAALASAPGPADGVAIAGNVSPDTSVGWSATPGAAGCRVWWRETRDPQWRWSRWVGDATQIKLSDVVIDNYFFGVSAVSSDGYESPIEFPGVAGAFFPQPATVPAPH